MLIVPLFLVLFLIFLWGIEYKVHKKMLESVPLRIHVNGTRGKSSVTRLITWGLMASGKKVVGKTTGSAPVVIVNGVEYPIKRVGKANIIEQLSVVKRAAYENADILVVECMAIDPELQYLSERKIIKSHIGVITNVRDDHIDNMGPTLERIADALSGTIPVNGILFTAERRYLERLKRNADLVGCKVVFVDESSVTDNDMANFSYVEHKENVALALAVCEYCGVKRDEALKMMWKVIPDVGVLRIIRIDFADHKIYFVNLFAANDPTSTEKIYNMLKLNEKRDYPVIIVCNSRKDRLDRLEQYKETLGKRLKADYYILTGAYVQVIADELIKKGIETHRVIEAETDDPSWIFDKILELAKGVLVVVGVGNIGGMGHKLANYFAARGKECLQLP